jgi:hypothetical protein
VIGFPFLMQKKIRCTSARHGFLFIAVMVLATAFFLHTPVSAKMAGAYAQGYQTAPNRFSSLSVRDFESRMRLFFESKIKGPRALLVLPRDQLPRETDFFLIAKLWNSLSPGFKTLYKIATQIPGTYQTYLSPGGHFAVYYLPLTSDSTNGVDVTDTMGYGVPGDWRPRVPGPNGIPDYIDEVAWALDSTYSMEVNRFSFIPPLPHKDSVHTSNRYPVVITWMSPGWYGETFPDASASGPRGFPSYLELRNNWNGSDWVPMGYNLHPENAIRVTCAHEHFHGIQYAMAWNTNLVIDDFPLTWIEGTAVCMEDLCFDYVNDYLQYAPYFFNNPGMSFFGFSYDNTVYTDALLVMYLFQKATGTPRIDFMHTIFLNDYAQLTPWDQNLRATSLSFGQPWPVFLNRFHTASFYTGARADTSRFLADARLMGEWSYSKDVFSSTNSVTKSVLPYGMQIFNVVPDTAGSDTLSLSLGFESFQNTIPYPTWGASCIVREGSRQDSIFSFHIDSAGLAICRIADWKSRSEILIIVSNGHPSQTKNATVTVSSVPRPSDQLIIFPNPGRINAKKFMRFEGNGIQEIRIYSVDGGLVASSKDKAFQRYGNGFIWQFANSHGKTVVPGYYTAVVTRTSAPAGDKKSTLHKVLVFP